MVYNGPGHTSKRIPFTNKELNMERFIEEFKLNEKQQQLLKTLVAAIRRDEKVGRGTCSTIDEAMTDNELCETLFVRFGFNNTLLRLPRTEASAVRRARKWERDHRSVVEDVQGY